LAVLWLARPAQKKAENVINNNFIPVVRTVRMDAYIILGFALSICIGISLGLIGGGGSMLTMPVLVYLFGISPVQSSSYSLFIVGITSMVGVVQYLRNDQIDYRAGVVFVLPSIVTVYLSRVYLMDIVSGSLMMLILAAFMILSSYPMLRDKQVEVTSSKTDLFQLAILGGLIGALTGLVGAGGGFLIIPTLVLMARLPMKTSVGTSLFVIAIKSSLGFAADFPQININWSFLASFTLLAVAGMAIGIFLSSRLPGTILKKAFAWVMIFIGLGIFFKELVI
jgi:uncharacterized membrane protein YfcA